MADAHWTHAYRSARARLRAQRLPDCWLCHGRRGPIRYDLAYPHPLSFSSEHNPPVSVAGPHLNLVPAHLGCQSKQGADITNAKRQRKVAARVVVSTRW
jgi:hypothetical protein